MNKFTFIDLFCGIGGFHQAMERLNGECFFASDIDKNCRETYFENYGLMPFDDITKVDENDIPAHDVICGGFPSKSFSKAGNRKGINDPRGTLFYDILRIAKKHKPIYMLLENVRNFTTPTTSQSRNSCKIKPDKIPSISELMIILFFDPNKFIINYKIYSDFIFI